MVSLGSLKKMFADLPLHIENGGDQEKDNLKLNGAVKYMKEGKSGIWGSLWWMLLVERHKVLVHLNWSETEVAVCEVFVCKSCLWNGCC